MSTRMQQRRGTSSQWTTSNPVLAAGEIGFETNTGKFKMGDGTSTWSALSYFTDSTDFDTTAIQGQISTAVSNAVDALVSGAPAALDTLNEIAASINNDATFYAAITTELNKKMNKINPYIETNLNANTFKIVNLGSPSSDNDAATKLFVDTVLNDHATDTTNIHGIGDTANLATKDYANTAISTHSSATTGIHGITDTQALATKTYADTAVSTHNSGTTNVHGISNTTDLATKTYATSAGTTAVSTHNSTTTNVHGIADTSVLATATTVATAKSEAITAAGTAADTKVSTAVAALTKSSVGLANVDNTSDALKPVSTATQTALNLKETVANVALKAPLASPTFTGTVTIPAGASISGFAPLASPALTGIPTAPTAAAATNTTQVATTAFVRGEVTALVNGASAALDTLGELAAALTADEATATTLSTLVGTKAPLASPTFTGTVTLPAGTVTSAMILDGTIVDADVNASAAIAQSKISGLSTSLGLKADLASPTFTGTVTVAASGVAFTDGTQTKAGVPSITNIPTALAAGAQTIAAGRADQFIPLTGAVVITLPATGYSTGQSIDFYQESSTGAYFASTNSVVGTPGLKFRTTNSVATAMKTSSGWLVFGDLSA